MSADRLYEQLDRVRNLISNAEANPLPNASEQSAVICHLEWLRSIYRVAWDAARKAEAAQVRS